MVSITPGSEAKDRPIKLSRAVASCRELSSWILGSTMSLREFEQLSPRIEQTDPTDGYRVLDAVCREAELTAALSAP